MTQPSLDVVRTRLDRAREHFADLEDACNRFMRDDPDTAGGIVLQIDSDRGEATARINIPADFPPKMGVLVGEALYHLRSALDNLAWQLVLANNGAPGKHTEFPVFKDRPKFKDSAPGMTRGMSDTARATIKRLQPFEAWPEHPEHTTLWAIHDLNNIDKHRLPHMACVWLAHANARLGAPGEVGAEGVYVAPVGPIEHDAKVFQFRWDPGRMKALEGQMQMDLDVSVDVAIHNPEATFLLDEEGDELRDAIPVRKLFNVAFDHLDATVLPAFADEFG